MRILLMMVLICGVQLKVAPSHPRVKRQYNGMMGGNNYNSYGNNNNNNNYGSNNYGRSSIQGRPPQSSINPSDHLKPWQPFQSQTRGSRGISGQCTVNPPGALDESITAKSGEVIEIACSTDSQPDSCTFTHMHPENMNYNGNSNTQEQDFKCTMSADAGASTMCQEDSRVSVISSNNMCGVRISNPQPFDTGIWKIYVNELQYNGRYENDNKEVTLYTFNQTITRLNERRDTDMEIPPTYEVNYNYDDRRDRWKDGTGNYETHEIQCNSQWGKPTPELTWSINRVDLDPRGQDIFKITEGSKGDSHGNSGLVYDWISEIEFTVDANFLMYLHTEHGIDVNPESGEFTFDLECNADQLNTGYSDRAYTRVSVRRIYNSGSYTANEIGMIVGITLGVIVLFIVGAVLLLVFAKSTERWCFANDDYRYMDPQDKRQVPSQAQVFSDENGGRRQPKTNPNFYTNSSIKSSGSDRSTKKKISHDDQPDVPRKTFDTGDPKNVERLYDTRVKSSASDSGLSSPSSSLDKHENMVAKPLSSAPPRSRPKSQFIPRQNHDKTVAHRLSLHTNFDNMVVDNNPQVFTVTNVSHGKSKSPDNVTYADLDPRAFMVPQNKVLPTKSNKRKNSSSDSRSTYASISSKPL